MVTSDQYLDTILEKVGHFGKYQRFVVALFSIAIIINSAAFITFVFTTKDLNYRCQVPYCEKTPEYNPSWLQNAILITEDRPAKCERFAHLNTTGCNYSSFNRSIVEICDDYVYETKEITIVQDFNLHCDENVWKLTLIGTLNGIGQFIGLPIAGYVSDRYGRLTMLVCGMVLAGICGIIRSFTTTYVLFGIFEFLDSLFGAGAYTCGYILGVELVGPKKRVLTGILICCSYALGGVLTGAIAWSVQSWRFYLRIVCGSSVAIIFYYWIAPESVRWMLIKKKYEPVKKTLRKVAEVNGKPISERTLEELCSITETIETKYPITDLFKSWILVLRFINCSFCWITCVFVFYGLTVNSVALSDNSYLDFILTSLVEIPGYALTYILVDKVGRRIGISSSLILTSICCVVFVFIPPELYWLKLSTYLLGKFAATGAFSICYIITTEIFPTCLRHSLMASCSMFGRIGSSIAPQMPLLELFWKPLPLILFGVMSAISGVLALHFPETSNIKLPDTIQEAEEIGNPKNKMFNKYDCKCNLML
ncbi:hypothetical protein RN001_006744 [Aquatica leii]|uniref:Major facilitator superfamily (MFS) profile domain-containing protein n=1 Tax=Aquatica leii TaxID=1421715 RepID=A0AAN7SSB1_9COLE|nr:hypothetical protein RN001_006744 [Aquatica leii]